jgi:hypothetical protein
MDGMSKEQFKKKWEDSHTELTASELLQAGRQGNLARVGKKELARIDSAKRLAEQAGIEKRAENLSNFLLDATAIRSEEILNKEELPIDKLLNLTIKTIPQQGKIEHTGNVEFTFADMVKRASIELEKVETIDVEIVDEKPEA